MQTLGEALSGLKLPDPAEGETPEERAERERDEYTRLVERMRATPATDKLERLLSGARERFDVIISKAAVGSRSVRVITEQIARLESDHQFALERDRIMGDRFVAWGCKSWCFGIGWRRDVMLVPNEHGGVVPKSIAEFCVCPEGLAAKEDIDQKRRRLQSEQARLRFARLFGDAHIPAEYARSTLDNHPNKRLARSCREWLDAQADHDVRHPWLYLHGGFGSGKTSAACAVGKEWMEGEHGPMLFRTVPDLLEELRASYGSDRMTPEERERAGVKLTSQLLQGYIAVSLLVLDDIAAENLTERNSGWVEEQLYKLLNARHNERNHTVLTSNVSLEELAAVVGDRVFNRVLRMARPVWSGDLNLRTRD